MQTNKQQQIVELLRSLLGTGKVVSKSVIRQRNNLPEKVLNTKNPLTGTTVSESGPIEPPTYAGSWFEITEKIPLDSSDFYYFRVKFNEGRMDTHFVQITPAEVITNAILRVDSDGQTSVLDNSFRMYETNVEFTYNATLNEVVMKEDNAKEQKTQFGTKCLPWCGLFAGAVVVTGLVAATIKYDL